ncbi:WhiB family transcriptional regulator [Streptomyces sp. NPDC051577]|uniref:WhiB family transcriptional regulator n=1 Tax=Streptomyces sp. NPDC051577 TaxID=3155166 RepID=UPI00342D7E9F
MTTSLYTRRGGRAISAVASPIGSGRADDWRDDALCRRSPDPSSFFPVGTTAPARAATERAKTYCGFCPVRAACARWALAENMEFGVWGGLDENERRSLRRHHKDDIDNPEQLHILLARRWKSELHDALLDAYLARSEQDNDGHVRWLLDAATISIRGLVLTSSQLAFRVGYGRRPDGTVKVTCGRLGCVAAEHLADNQIRQQLKRSLRRAA